MKVNLLKSLDELGLLHNTDKASLDRTRNGKRKNKTGHNYLVKYEHFLRHLREKEILMLELGAGPEWNCGASAKVWDDYFKNAKEICIAEINPYATKIANDKITVKIGDLGDNQFLKELSRKKWDFILDDASHRWDHQLQALIILLPVVKDGGLYIVEDIHTSFGLKRSRYHGSKCVDALGYSPENRPDTMKILSEIAIHLVGGEQHPILEGSITNSISMHIALQLDSITFIGHSAILVKKSKSGGYLVK